MMSRYNVNSTMRLIGKQELNYLAYNNGLDKIDDILNAHVRMSDVQNEINAKELMYDTYVLGFIQGVKYSREKWGKIMSNSKNTNNKYSTNATMRLIGKQNIAYIYYKNGLKKMQDILIGYYKSLDKDSKLPIEDIMWDTYLLGFLQGKNYANEKLKESK